MSENIYQRTEILIGKENVEKLKNKHVVICGIGGVGSYSLEALARVGISKLTIIDKDVVDITNINRQIIATSENIGRLKVDVAKERIKNINRDINVVSVKLDITKENISDIFKEENIDYIVDCVDNIDAKVAIITESTRRNIKCISCMGMGNKMNPLDIKVGDIYKTINCPLSKIMRKKLKEQGIKKQKVVYSIEIPKFRTEEEKLIYGNTLGSISFVPSTAGLIMASEVIKDLIEK